MNEHTVPLAFTGNTHDHAACVAEAMRRADAVCAERSLRLTPLRRQTLELVWCNHKPVKAYDLLMSIRSDHRGAAPPTIYRALDFLLDAGLIHRIESLNAFIGCDAGHGACQPKFLICKNCERAVEIAGERLEGIIADEADAAGFQVDREVVEIYGLCGQCAAA